MSIRMVVAILAAVVASAIAATSVGATQTALKACGTAKAAGFTFHVFEAKLPSCTAARSLTLKLGHLGITNPGIRHYAGVYLSMRCFAAAKGKSAQIQCTSRDGRKSLYAVARS